MKLNLLLFGVVADLLETSSLKINIDNECTIQQFKKQLLAQYPVLENINSYAIAVNEEYATNNTVLKENDIVAIIPPVSGG